MMARTPQGAELIEIAKKVMDAAETADEIRICQAFLFPLLFKFSIVQTASLVGRSTSWVSQKRGEFIKNHGLPNKPGAGGRRRQNMTIEEEKELLASFQERASVGGILVVGDIRRAIEEKLGRPIALASAYNMLHRHGWRKLAPDKRHVKTDVAAQKDWKKNSPSSSARSGRTGRKAKTSN